MVRKQKGSRSATAGHCGTSNTLPQLLLQERIHQHQFTKYWQAKSIIKQVTEQKSNQAKKLRRSRWYFVKTYYWGVEVWQKLIQFWHKFTKQRMHGFQKPELQISFPLLKLHWNTSFRVTKCCLFQESELHIITCAPSNRGLKPEGFHSSELLKCRSVFVGKVPLNSSCELVRFKTQW